MAHKMLNVICQVRDLGSVKVGSRKAGRMIQEQAQALGYQFQVVPVGSGWEVQTVREVSA